MEEKYWVITAIITVMFWLVAAGIFADAYEDCDEKTGPSKASIIITLLFIFWPVGLVVCPLWVVGYLFFILFSKTEEESDKSQYIKCPYCGNKLIIKTEKFECENCGYSMEENK